MSIDSKILIAISILITSNIQAKNTLNESKLYINKIDKTWFIVKKKLILNTTNKFNKPKKIQMKKDFITLPGGIKMEQGL